MVGAAPENAFVFGETLSESAFIDRKEEAHTLERDLADGQKVILVSQCRIGKSALIHHVLRRLDARGMHTGIVPVASYTSYREFLEASHPQSCGRPAHSIGSRTASADSSNGSSRN